MRKSSSLLAISAAALSLALVAPAQAADDGGFTAGSILVRLRGLDVMPDVSSNVPTVKGSVSIDSNTVPEVDATYFFTPNLAAEVIAGVTFHDVADQPPNAINAKLGLGSVRLLPPTVTAQWHFLPTEKINPYVGAGINYTFFYGVHNGPSNLIYSTHYSDRFGAALQAGVDYNISGRWYLNADVKKIFLSTDVTLGTAVGKIKANVDINPYLVGFGFGYRF